MKVFDLIIQFLEEIKMPYKMEALNEETFLPGLDIRQGVLIIDQEKCLYPGDILHEAGHLAVMTPSERSDDEYDIASNMGNEIAVQLWSYAALYHIGLEPNVVFHENGYKGASDWMIDNFTNGRYLGLPLLQYYEMAYDETRAKEENTQAFPHMLHWLRQ